MSTTLANVQITFTYQQLNELRCLVQNSIDNLTLMTIGINSKDIRFVIQSLDKLKLAREIILMRMLDAKR